MIPLNKTNNEYRIFMYIRYIFLLIGGLMFSVLAINLYAEETKDPLEKEEETEKNERVTSKHKKPIVTISGREIITRSAKKEKTFINVLPEALQTKRSRALLEKRTHIVPANHNPYTGSTTAPLQIILFSDMSCTPCVTLEKELNKIKEKEKLADHMRITHIYMPENVTRGTNLAEFYGKLAQKYGKFWEYREALLKMRNLNEEAYLELLLEIGVSKMKTRSSAIRHARKFYKELDWDAAFAKKSRLKNPPHIFINGIHLGSNGIDLKYLPDIINYESFLKGIKE